MNAVPLLNQSVLEGNPSSLSTSKSSSFSVRDILELPSSQQSSYSSGDLSLRSSYRSASSGADQMITHDLYPQNSLRHLPLSAGTYQQQEERQFQDRFSYSPQYTESRSTSSTEPRFSFVQDNQQSFRHQSETQQSRPVLNTSLSGHHGINVGSNSHISAMEKRVHSVESLPEITSSTSLATNIQTDNSTSFSSGMLGKSMKNIQNHAEEIKNENFVGSISEESHYPSTVDFSSAKEKYPLGVEEHLPADFPSSSLLRKSENDVFLPDDNSSSEKTTANWPKMEDSAADMKYKGNWIFLVSHRTSINFVVVSSLPCSCYDLAFRNLSKELFVRPTLEVQTCQASIKVPSYISIPHSTASKQLFLANKYGFVCKLIC